MENGRQKQDQKTKETDEVKTRLKNERKKEKLLGEERDEGEARYLPGQ